MSEEVDFALCRLISGPYDGQYFVMYGNDQELRFNDNLCDPRFSYRRASRNILVYGSNGWAYNALHFGN